MKNTNLAFRTAISTALNPIVYNTSNIWTFEEYLQETTTRKKVKIGEADVFIILLNQTLNENSPKCIRNDEVSIQIQINTIWPAGKGGSKLAEEISELVMNKLFTTDGLFKNIELPEPFGLWKMYLLTVRNINYNETSSRAWITQMVISAEVTQ